MPTPRSGKHSDTGEDKAGCLNVGFLNRDGRCADSSPAQLLHVADSRQGHQTGAHHPPRTFRARLSLPATPPGSARMSRLGVSQIQRGDLCARVLLAWPRVLSLSMASGERHFLAKQDHAQSRTRCRCSATVVQRGLARADSLGVCHQGTKAAESGCSHIPDRALATV